ncbi:acetylcholine receptor subunit alpha-type acr-16-like [Condylostylus longicornis]|uniref:acetylcholine receptor subunit alpha-type acr-16-like n=1 Tax=Condylostylus longicornis TaxID=2530218 RepID=UPI00244DB6E6|nr:acetylcholine receptor subunit alpha-type acr-16-like [Condylostylus longicornis]
MILKKRTIIIFCLFFGIKLITAENDEPATTNTTTIQLSKDNELDRLKRDLLVNYDKYSKPSSKPLISLCVNYIAIDLDEHAGIFKIYLWLVIEWKDPKLVWNRNDYSNISFLNFAVHEIWQPEVVAFNSVDQSMETYPDTLMIAYNDGSMLWVPPHEFKVFCDMDFSLWPYDKQNCSLKLGTWASRDIKFFPKKQERCFDTSEEDKVISEWKTNKIVVQNGTDPITNYDYVEFSFELQRRTALHRILIITPATCIILMILSSFWLPPQCGEKILLNGINALLILAFLMYFGQLLPILADHTPLIVLFLCNSLLLTSFSMIISVCVIYIADINHEKRLPQYLRNILNNHVCNILCLSHLSVSVDNTVNNDEDEPKIDGNSSQDPQIFELSSPSTSKKIIKNDWITFAVAIDRLSFIVYCIIFAILAIKYSV